MAFQKPMARWEVWLLDQSKSRAETEPPQPNDPTKPVRPFVIVAEPHNRADVICCEIKNAGQSVYISEVPLQYGYGGFIKKGSKIVCHSIYTLRRDYFYKQIGKIAQNEQNQIKLIMKKLLG